MDSDIDHAQVGNTAAYTTEQWTSDIELAQSYGIDAFVLNIGTPWEGTSATQAVRQTSLLQIADLTDPFPELCLPSMQCPRIRLQTVLLLRL